MPAFVHARRGLLNAPSFGVSRPFAALTAAAVGFSVLPLLWTRYLPLLDIYAHESRAAVLRDILLTGRGSSVYGLDSLLLPNVGFDLVAMVLTLWMGPEMAGRVFVGATLALTLGGTVALSRVTIGRWSVVPLAAGLLAFNLFTLLGFLSYGLGIALMLWALAGRRALMQAGLAAQFLAGCLFGLVLLLCHLSAFAVYAVMLAGFGLDMLLRRQAQFWPVFWRVALMGAELLPAVAVFALMPTGGQGHMHYDLPYLQAKIFNGVKAFSSGSIAGDAAFAVGAVALAVLLAFGGRLRLSRVFVPGLALLTGLYFAVPSHVSGGSYVDSRLPVVIVLLALSAVDFRIAAGRFAWALPLVVAGAFVAKQAALAWEWHQQGRELAQIADVLDGLPDGAVILQAECQPAASDVMGVYASRQPPLTHVAAMAGFKDSRYVASTWTIKGQQPVRTLPPYLPYKAVQDRIGPSVCGAGEYRAIWREAMEARARQGGAGNTPLYLLLLRPPEFGTLLGVAQRTARLPMLELYTTRPE